MTTQDRENAQNSIDGMMQVNEDTSNNSDQDGVPDCAICLQQCLHPVQLPCGHIFCFLCMKGTASRSQRCALCRRDIPPGYVFNPHLLCEAELVETPTFEDGYQWFYEGVNGWWQYDPRTSTEMEQSYKNDQPFIEVLIAGFLYVIDFKNMVQMRRTNPTRRRRIKRDIVTIADKKGVAGIKVAPAQQQFGRETGDGTDTPVSTSAVAGITAAPLGGAVKQPRRDNTRSFTSGMTNTTPGGGQQSRTAFLTTNGIPAMTPGGAVRQLRSYVSNSSDSSSLPTTANIARTDGRQTRSSSTRQLRTNDQDVDGDSSMLAMQNNIPSDNRQTKQLRSNAGHDVDGYSSMTASLNTVPSDRQTRASSARHLTSHTSHDLDGSSLLVTLDVTSGGHPTRVAPTGATVMTPDSITRQLRSNTTRDIDGSPLPVTPNTTPNDDQQTRVAPTGASSMTPDGTARQLRLNAGHGVSGSLLSLAPNATPSGNQQTRVAPTGATSVTPDGAVMQPQSNAASGISGSPDSTPGGSQQIRIAPTGAISVTRDGVARLLRSSAVCGINGGPNSISSDNQHTRPAPTGANSITPDGAARQMRLNMTPDVDGLSLPGVPNTTPVGSQRSTMGAAQQDITTNINALANDIFNLEIGDSGAEDLAVREVLGEESE